MRLQQRPHNLRFMRGDTVKIAALSYTYIEDLSVRAYYNSYRKTGLLYFRAYKNLSADEIKLQKSARRGQGLEYTAEPEY